MGKKGSNQITYTERPQSAQELQLLDTQNKMMQQGVNIAQEQENRSEAMYQDWKNNYQGIETGEIKPTANRENGYSNNPNIKSKDEYAAYQEKRAALQAKIQELRGRQQSNGIARTRPEVTGERQTRTGTVAPTADVLAGRAYTGAPRFGRISDAMQSTVPNSAYGTNVKGGARR